MTTDAPAPTPTDDCARFDARLGPWLERDLDDATDGWMAQHRATCAACDTMARDVEQLVAAAGALPPLSPPRDLWPSIEARLETPVIPMAVGGSGSASPPATRTITLRRFALAAAVLVAVSSGVTWQLARRSQQVVGVAPQVAAAPSDAAPSDEPLSGATTELAVGSPASVAGDASRARLVSDDDVPDAGVTYQREIVALRQIVDERFSELDTSTVRELRRNLDIIDQAIADSQAALARDPRSGLLSAQLDRALQAKLELLRRVALL